MDERDKMLNFPFSKEGSNKSLPILIDKSRVAVKHSCSVKFLGLQSWTDPAHLTVIYNHRVIDYP